MSLLKILTQMSGAGGGTAPPADPATANIVLLVGQSNAVGTSSAEGYPTTTPAEWSGPQSNIQMWWEGAYNNPVAGHFEPMEIGVNTVDADYYNPASGGYGQALWGVEQKFARLLQAHLNETVYIIKNAYGGRRISYWYEPSGAMWVELQRYVTEAVAWCAANGKTPVFRAILWLQGENDVQQNDYVNYGAHLQTVLASIRSLDSGLAATPFLMMKLRTDMVIGGVNSTEGIGYVNSGMDTVAGGANNYALDPMTITGAEFTPDDLHYKDTGLIALGQAFYDKWETLQ